MSLTDTNDVVDAKTLTPTAAGVAAAGMDSGGGSGPGTPVAVGKTYQVEQTRQAIAFILLGILALVILIEAIAGAIFATDCWFFSSKGSCPQARESLAVLTSALGTVFTAMVGLVGSVVGFYFGSQKQG